MRKTLAIALLVSLFGFGTAMADILPEGQKVVPVCAYFNNTADFLDQMAIYGYETAPGGEVVDFSSFIANECFHPSYKFNTYGVYGVTVEHAATLDLDNYDPTVDEEAYPTNIQPEMGEMMVDDTSTLESVSNEYTIIGLDLENKVLEIEPAGSTKYFNDGSDPEVIEGEITPVTMEEESMEEEEPMEEETEDEASVEDLFTDVDSTSEYYDALKYLKDEGIIGGYPDGSFKPDNTINRAEFTKIVMGSTSTEEARSNCYTNYAVEGDYMITLFTDVDFAAVGGNEPAWYFDYVCVAKLNGVIGGYPDGSFKPAQDINFVEAAKIIVESLGYQTMETEPWYQRYVMEFANRNAIPESITMFDQKVTRGQMAEIMYRLRAGVDDLPSMKYEDLK